MKINKIIKIAFIFLVTFCNIYISKNTIAENKNSSTPKNQSFIIDIQNGIDYQSLDAFFDAQNNKQVKYAKMTNDNNLILSDKPIILPPIYQPQSLASLKLKMIFNADNTYRIQKIRYQLVDQSTFSLPIIPRVDFSFLNTLPANKINSAVINHQTFINLGTLAESAVFFALALMIGILFPYRTQNRKYEFSNTSYLITPLLITTNQLYVLCNLSAQKSNINVNAYFYMLDYMVLQLSHEVSSEDETMTA